MTDSNDRDERRPPRRTGAPFRPARPGDAPRAKARRPSGPVRRDDAPAAEAPAAPAEDRIAKVIARAGLASRRDAEAMIAAGRVSLNGELLTSPAINVGPADRIAVDGDPLPSRERTRLWLFHKPRGLVTTFRDPQGRPTVFEALPDDLPRVVAIGRLDINTEGLLLLTNDGGLAKVIAHPETGWTRRYRVRARGETTQAELDKLKRGITVDDMDYGPIEATLDRIQGDNMWLTLALREGKNREVKRVLEHLGIQVNRLIRLSFGPFQLGELEPGLVEEVRTRVLKDQLGQALAEEAGVDFESAVREPIAAFGAPADERPRPADRTPRPRTTRPAERFEARPERARPPRDGRPPRRDEDRREPSPASRPKVWRSGDAEDRPRRPAPRREDPKADRAASASRQRERVGAVDAPDGRKVRVERVVRSRDADERRPPARERPPRAREDSRPPRRAAPDRPRGPSRPDASSGKRPPRPGFAKDGGRPPRPPAGGRGGGFAGGRSRPPGGPGGRSGPPKGRAR